MARKKKPAEGAPLWIVTYGDMMSLLLTFFILLAALSELRREDMYSAKAEEVKMNFGQAGGGGARDMGLLEPKVTVLPQLTNPTLAAPSQNQTTVYDRSIKGKNPEVQSLRQEELYSIGVRIVFDQGSAQLTDQHRELLREASQKITGIQNRVELRGHASNLERGQNPEFPELWTLSYARSRAVMEFLTGAEIGIDERRLKLTAAADNDPLVVRYYSQDRHEENRRVDILVSSHLVTDAPIP